MQSLKTPAKLVSPTGTGQLTRVADTRVVIQALVLGLGRQKLAQLRDMGVVAATREVVVGAVAADDELPCHVRLH